jgi:flagellar biosynthesis/type III secretory pathway protein FliH
MKRKRSDQDSPWKDILERYFQEFMAFFFPRAHGEIDWSRGHEFLDKEFQRIVRDATLGRRLLDKLVKVHLSDGLEAWVLVHVEVQGWEDRDFAKRMFVYHYRIFDRYDRRVASLAILADEEPDWRPSSYGYDLWDCSVEVKFPAIKLLDYAPEWSSLVENPNPFAVITMAHLKTQATRRDDRERLRWKLTLVKMLYQRGYKKQDILELFRFIDWLLTLPEDLEESFSKALSEYEEEKKMPYVTSVERLGIKKGLKEGLQRGLQKGLQKGLQRGMLQNAQQSVIEILETRFETVPDTLARSIEAIEDLAILQRLLKRAVVAASLDEFQESLA